MLHLLRSYKRLNLVSRQEGRRERMHLAAEMGSQARLHAKPVTGDTCME